MDKEDNIFVDYQKRLCDCLSSFDWSPVRKLAEDIRLAWDEERHVFLCGNGGSAANAIHIANDLLYPVTKNTKRGIGVKVTALTANQSILTCLGNDIGYENIFSFQLETLGKEGDILIVLSGSGNSPNILNAVHAAKKKGIKTYGILGFNGGRCLEFLDVPVHFAVNDMQILEDLQLIAGHMLMQWLIKGQIPGKS
ncbi:MAG: SIS domain-containing protein [Candidatus Omnitrophota bacterium]|jgi:D-sedoheptulose 7-phosphate isomerase